ncbi:hypothetical protein Y1Q_0014327 [Alligator mississippiensis]|uniref:Uncharacterized protein n=1 Tax=Alligator mississippiensis TaxID=8496 RepID=A0A151N225_ALLMI|nr:hypothetical protein Y1Q_0014327 [Alligator mississippiensis]
MIAAGTCGASSRGDKPSRSNLHIVIRKSRPNSSLIYSGYTPRDILDYTEVTLELHQRHCLQNLACQWSRP